MSKPALNTVQTWYLKERPDNWLEIEFERAHQEINAVELAWAAGFFDGEGCTYTETRKRVYGESVSVRMTVAQNDLRPLERFHAATGVGHIHQAKRGYYVWGCGHQGDVRIAIARLFPHLSEPKREQIERCLLAGTYDPAQRRMKCRDAAHERRVRRDGKGYCYTCRRISQKRT